MKPVKIIIALLLSLSFAACNDYDYLSDVYVEPVASFHTAKDTYEVFESVVFTNTGSGQNYVIYTGDQGHNYHVEGDTGFATATNGTFSYSYSEPGEYIIVWIASSMNMHGKIEQKTVQDTIHVESRDGGLDKLVISKLCKLPEYGNSVFYNAYAQFIDNTNLMCPILFMHGTTSLFIP